MRDLTNPRGANAYDVVIKGTKMNGLEVREISRDVEREDLLAVDHRLGPSKETIQHDRAMCGGIAFTNEQFAVFKLSFDNVERVQCKMIGR